MLSVLLPVYNYFCGPLLQELHKQLTASGIPFEIIVMEDGSIHCIKENQKAADSIKCHYTYLSHNIGRSAIRNRLAKTANYEWLLFMDCDSRLVRHDYISRYLRCMQENKDWVICGGRVFGAKEDTEPEYLLHWYCGTEREPKASDDNQQRAFLSNNFIIRKEIFNNIVFEEGLKGYGHEDTLFGLELQKAGFNIRYIDNPVFHEGLDSNEAFLVKSRIAVANLRLLKERYLSPQDYSRIRLLHYYDKLEPLYLDRLLARIYDIFRQPIEKQLKSKKPNLYLFDLYKLGFLCKIMKADLPQSHKIDH